MSADSFSSRMVGVALAVAPPNRQLMDALNNKSLREPVPKDATHPSIFVKITSGDHNDTISTCIEGENNHVLQKSLSRGTRDRGDRWLDARRFH